MWSTSGSDFQKLGKNDTYPTSDCKLHNHTITVFLKQVSYTTVVFKNFGNVALNIFSFNEIRFLFYYC